MPIPLTIALLTFNRKSFLKESLFSIFQQTYRNFEIIVLDNHSTDGTPELILGLNDARLRYVRNAPGHDMLFNVMSAVQMARGERLLIFHDDDIMEPRMVERAMEAFGSHPSITGVWCNHSIIDEAGAFINEKANPKLENFSYKKFEYLEKFISTSWWPYPSGFFFTPKYLPNSITLDYRKAGNHRRYLRLAGADPLCLMEMNFKGGLEVIGEPLFRYRRHGNQDSLRTDLAGPVLNMYRQLFKAANRYKMSQTIIDQYSITVKRFEAQAALISAQKFPLTKALNHKLRKIALSLTSDIDLSARALSINAWCLEILFAQLGFMCCDYDGRVPLSSPLERGLWSWVQRKRVGENMFDDFPSGVSLSILGSSLIGALLLLEAKLAGVGRVSVIDSNINRIGKKMLGEIIHPTSSLGGVKTERHVVILSSERDQDDALTAMIKSFAPDVYVASWKQIAEFGFDEVVDGWWRKL